jgi:ubiquinone biosynthesis protein UbiJ
MLHTKNLPAWLSRLDQNLARLPQLVDQRIPHWLRQRAEQKLVLFFNHVLQDVQEARNRLQRHQGKVLALFWLGVEQAWKISPVGLVEPFNLKDWVGFQADLRILVLDESPLQLTQKALCQEKPAMRIEGDVQLAAELNWLLQNLQWDAEEDLSRFTGDALAHVVVKGFSRAGQGLGFALRSTLAGFVKNASGPDGHTVP